jgi:hypothetical protein
MSCSFLLASQHGPDGDCELIGKHEVSMSLDSIVSVRRADDHFLGEECPRSAGP